MVSRYGYSCCFFAKMYVCSINQCEAAAPVRGEVVREGPEPRVRIHSTCHVALGNGSDLAIPPIATVMDSFGRAALAVTAKATLSKSCIAVQSAV